MKLAGLILAFGIVTNVSSQYVYEYMDLQIHPTMHITYPFFGKGLTYFDPSIPPDLSYMHQFTNVNYANYLQNNKGLRIMVTGSLCSEYATDHEKAKNMILKHIQYINDFAARNADHFVVCKTPGEVRHYVKNTDKTIIIHSIEGGQALIRNQEDANFWAEQGVAFITLVHLVDSEYGGAAILPGLPTRLINHTGSTNKNKEKGLTEHGKNAILWLANAGIMTDVTHMNDRTRKEALRFMMQHSIPPISTHDGFKPVQNHARALDEADIIHIYESNGFISLPVSGFSLAPYHSDEKYATLLKQLPRYCDGSIDSYKFTYLAVKEFIENEVFKYIYPDKKDFSELSEAEKINLSIGFQTDFNGWLNHSRPRYGKNGCDELLPDTSYLAIETEGMPHPGMMESHWQLLEKEKVDIDPIKRSSEKFLQLWEYFLLKKGSFQ